MERPILVVDDSPADVELLQVALERCCNQLPVIVIGDGQRALDYLKCEGEFSGRGKADPQFVLLDLKMPLMSGLEMLETVRATAALRFLPIVVLTSSRLESDVARAYELGANAFLQKPTSFSELEGDIAKILSVWGSLNRPPPRFPIGEVLGAM
ncbi:response regulator [Caballeronia sp. LZ062]|uniref:response regulator n=1 Tax=unclassified Caballeronia TaxID=2646786 RepID=UPI00285C0418|nr:MULTISPECIES: response regulator [unclassified Caballeronia]MDR5855720.1 response regulator [Caballeronia sp. LZ050]MDR5872493.1 response regulator [Caballeronia sp. LZ062]